MSKKNLPHIPLYIGDWEKDCNVLSLESEAAWLRIIFKMFSKGKQSSIKLTSKALQNLWRVSTEKMNEILKELIDNDISDITIESDLIEFVCRRYVHENSISEVRSIAGSSKSKSKKESKLKQNKNKIEQNTDNDIDIDNNIDIDNEYIKKHEKIKFGTNSNILLTELEKDKLIEDYGNDLTYKAINFLSDWGKEKPQKFKEYKDHNLTLRRWVFEAVGQKKETKTNYKTNGSTLEAVMNRN